MSGSAFASRAYWVLLLVAPVTWGCTQDFDAFVLPSSGQTEQETGDATERSDAAVHVARSDASDQEQTQPTTATPWEDEPTSEGPVGEVTDTNGGELGSSDTAPPSPPSGQLDAGGEPMAAPSSTAPIGDKPSSADVDAGRTSTSTEVTPAPTADAGVESDAGGPPAGCGAAATCDVPLAACALDCERDREACELGCTGNPGACKRECLDAKGLCELDCTRTCDDCYQERGCASGCVTAPDSAD